MVQTQSDSRSSTFFVAGFRELRRMFGRYALKRELRRNAEQRDVALGALGAKAWAEKIDLAPFGTIRDRLDGATARSGEIAATAQQLDAQKSARETERRSELDKFQAHRRAVEDKKRPADAALKSAREKHGNSERSVAQARSRLVALAAELATLERELAALSAAADAEAATKTAAAHERQNRLRAEQGALTSTLTAAESQIPGLAAEVARLQNEAGRFAAEIAALDSEQKAVVAHLDGELGRIRSGLQAATQQQRAVGKEQAALYRELGQVLYDSRNLAPVLDESARNVAAIDAARAKTESRMQDSQAATQALPAGTMPKFWGVVVGVPLLVTAVAFGSHDLIKRYWPNAWTTATAPAGPNPEDEKDKVVQSFLKAGKASDSQARLSAVKILKEDILATGSTGNTAHLPMLVKILYSTEPELRAAAADAIGMIRPTAAETDALVPLLKDPAVPVAEAVRRALEDSRDPAARELVTKTEAAK